MFWHPQADHLVAEQLAPAHPPKEKQLGRSTVYLSASPWVGDAPAPVPLPHGQSNSDIQGSVLRLKDAWRRLAGAHHQTQEVNPNSCSAPL